MKPKEMLQHIEAGLARSRERFVLFFEPEFTHAPECVGDVILKRTVENKPAFRVIYRQCESCGVKDRYEENYPQFTHSGNW